MRALVTRSIRPRIGSTGTHNLSSTASPVRQAIFPPTRRKLTFNDAFTILLAPVFAAAFVADSTSKDKRREEWDRKIAEVKEEIEAIRERELQSWNAVQLRSVQVGAKQQRRGYATAARALKPEENLEVEPDQTSIENQTETVLPMGVSKKSRRQPSPFDASVLANWQQYEALLASKLALELLLHIRTGKSWLYRQPVEVYMDPDLFPQSLDGLMVQLHHVNDALKQINSKKLPGEVPYRLLTMPERGILHENITSLAKDCKEGRITVAQLVYGYANAIGASKTAPKSTTYRALVDAFLTLDNESLAYTAMSALQNCQQRLNNADIGTMLYQYGHFKDSGRFTKFLRLLVKKEASCILRLTCPWEHVYVNGVRVPTPVDRNPDIIATSIKAALQCGMVQHAEAWTAILFQTGSRERLGTVMRSIVVYYTEHCDWTYGSRWLQEIIKRIALIADESAGELSKCILRLLELCVACNKSEIYENIMDALLTAGVSPSPIDSSRPEFFSDRIHSIRHDWESRREVRSIHQDHSKSSQNAVEQATQFQRVLTHDDPTLSPYIGIINADSMARITNALEAAEPAKAQLRPLQSPAELLKNKGARSLQSPNKQSEITAQQRIIELEKQLAETQKHNADLHAQLRKQSNHLQSDNKIQHTKKPESALTHLHLVTDHQKLLDDHTTHDALLESQGLRKQKAQQERKYASSPRNTKTAPDQGHEHPKIRAHVQNRAFHSSVRTEI